jgi:hypothetical protein
LLKRWLFFILDFGLKRQKKAQKSLKRPKKAQKSLKRPNEGNKFCILDGTKHNPENFGILHSIVPN